jgi:hypothetical protein
MRVCRALVFASVLVAAPFAARGQFGGMPGMPGSMPGAPGGFGVPPPQAGPPPACRELMSLRDETQKHGMAIQKANERKATVQDACKLFKTYLTAEAKFIRGLEDHSRTCGVPPDAIKRARESHAKAGQVSKQVCDVAALGPRPYRSDPWDVLREDSQKQGQSEDDNCSICWKPAPDDFWWPDKRNPLPGPR